MAIRALFLRLNSGIEVGGVKACMKFTRMWGVLSKKAVRYYDYFITINFA